MAHRVSLPILGAVLIVAVTAIAVGYPAVFVAMDIAWSAASAGWVGVDVALLTRSVGIAALIAGLATALAWPAAWALRGAAARWALIVGVPLLLPSYLAYTAWGMIRAPGTILGDWLLAGPLTGPNSRPVIAGQVLAVAGLALWAWPIPAFVLLARLRRLDAAVLEALRLEPASRWRRAVTVVAMCRGSLGAAVGLTTLVMLGSAVPLHVAQLDTYAIRLWRLLDETPAHQDWRVWLSAWPLVLGAVAGAWVILRRLPGTALSSAQQLAPRARTRWSRSAVAIVLVTVLWLVSVAGPIMLCGLSLRGWSSVRTFWQAQVTGLSSSVLTSAAVGAAGAALALAVWAVLAGGARRARQVTRACVLCLLAAGLVPGVLIGSATAEAWNRFDTTAALADSSAIMVIGLLARYGFVGALLGWWLHRTDPADERDLRRLDGADTAGGWARVVLPHQGPVLVGGAVVLGVLAFHEIEAAVFIAPPGSGRFAQRMLELLHFARMEDLGAGVVTVVGGGLAASAGAVILLSMSRAPWFVSATAGGRSGIR